MALEDRLRERLRKAEALLAGAAAAGDRSSAEERLKAKLNEAHADDPPLELMFTMPDAWSVHLFTALCRRYGFKPYRYPRQRRTTVLVKAPRYAFEAMVWRQFKELHETIQSYFENTIEQPIRLVVHANVSDAETVPEPVRPAR